MDPVVEQPPEVSDDEVIMASSFRKYCPIKWEELIPTERSFNGDPFCNAVEMLFFKGGSLASVGLQPKPGVEAKRVIRFIKATLGDFEPSHEHKIGGVAHMLKKWCTLDKPSSTVTPIVPTVAPKRNNTCAPRKQFKLPRLKGGL